MRQWIFLSKIKPTDCENVIPQVSCTDPDTDRSSVTDAEIKTSPKNLTKNCNPSLCSLRRCKKLFTRLFLVRYFQFREHSSIITFRPLQFIPGSNRQCNQVLASLIRVICLILEYTHILIVTTVISLCYLLLLECFGSWSRNYQESIMIWPINIHQSLSADCSCVNCSGRRCCVWTLQTTSTEVSSTTSKRN